MDRPLKNSIGKLENWKITFQVLRENNQAKVVYPSKEKVSKEGEKKTFQKNKS